jgi:hypothetical protein
MMSLTEDPGIRGSRFHMPWVVTMASIKSDSQLDSISLCERGSVKKSSKTRRRTRKNEWPQPG